MNALQIVTDPATPAAHVPTDSLSQQASRFEAYLRADTNELPADRYVAPPAPPALPDSAVLRHASDISHKIRAGLEMPMKLPEDAPDIERLEEAMRQNQAFMCAQVEFQCHTKVAELSTRNLQTLYQMQG